MKKISQILIVAIMLLGISLPVWAEDEILLSGPMEHGGYGSIQLESTLIGGKPAMMVGGYGGWLVNHKLLIGVGAYALVTDIKAPASVQNPENSLYFQTGYAGILVEYIFNSSKSSHLSISNLIGVGVVNYGEKTQWVISTPSNGDSYFVLEPGIHWELNLTKFWRINAGVSYRYVSGVELAGINNQDLSTVSFRLGSKFGKF
jgi:hypothetical protein